MKLRRTLITVLVALAAATMAAAGSARPVADAPTMSKIAYFNFDSRDSGFDVMLANTDGSGVTNITHDGTAKMNTDPNWSADGTKVAYTSYNGAGSADIIVVNANGKGSVNLTPDLRKGILNIHPTWSPDGSIVFASNRDGNFDLYRIGTATTTSDSLVRMTKTEAPTQNLDPDYSADGRILVFSRTAASSFTAQTASLVTMRATPGAPAMKLTQAFMGLGDRGATWSPNGQQVAFYSDRDANSNLYLVNRDGSGLTQLTSDKADDSVPSWSPDGTTLVFLSNRSDYTELWMTSLVGLTPGAAVAWEITFDKQLKGSPDWQPFSTSSIDPPKVN